MAKFNLEAAKIMDGDGVEREYAIIANRATFKKVELHPGDFVTCGRGFIRCQGKQYLATFGKETPVMIGDENEIYYAPMSFFDGEWRAAGPDSRGLHKYVTAKSGAGKLFGDLEKFSADNAVPVCG
jgi:hypothetical protein